MVGPLLPAEGETRARRCAHGTRRDAAGLPAFAFPSSSRPPLIWREKRLLPTAARFLLGLTMTGSGLFLATALQGRGLGAWDEFRAHMHAHMDVISPNTVGLTGALAYHETPPTLSAEEMRAERARRARIRQLGRATFFWRPCSRWRCQRRENDVAASLGRAPAHTGLGPPATTTPSLPRDRQLEPTAAPGGPLRPRLPATRSLFEDENILHLSQRPATVSASRLPPRAAQGAVVWARIRGFPRGLTRKASAAVVRRFGAVCACTVTPSRRPRVVE
jgi:hypothetical protein